MVVILLLECFDRSYVFLWVEGESLNKEDIGYRVGASDLEE
jgi:hypothetical protein